MSKRTANRWRESAAGTGWRLVVFFVNMFMNTGSIKAEVEQMNDDQREKLSLLY
jgi:hypothetical protein